MGPRHTPPEGAAAFPLAGRGVYAQPYLLHGRREYYAVSSTGEQVAVRLVNEGADPAPFISDLWDELNHADPMPSHLAGPVLRLVR